MRRAFRSLTDVRGELICIQEEFTRLQKRIDTARDTVADALTRIFGERRPAFSGLAEEELIERIADRAVVCYIACVCQAESPSTN
jgi:hypothetical protein